MKIPEFPKVIRIEPASQCNLKCNHCPTGTIDMNRGIMKYEIFEKILSEIDQFKDYVEVIVLYHGGEPLLNKNFFKMIYELKKIKNSLFIKTVTNGMALNNNNCKKIVSSDLDLIEISLDGTSSEQSESIRIGSSSKRIVENIKFLLDQKKEQNSKIRIEITTTQFYDPETKKDVVTPSWLLETFKDRDIKFKPTFAYLWPDINLGKNYKIHYVNNGILNTCDHVVNTLTVRSNGDIVACCYDLTTKLKTGNIQNQKIKDIWKDKKYQIIRDGIENKKPVGVCGKCSVIKPNYYILPT
tara:strand:+ start:263 stop:1156 length:894 start_codon:yes stop_codon:yes gene_type:complete